MLFYWGLLIICFLLARIAMKISNKNEISNIFIFLIVAILSLVSGWRYNTGSDYYQYYQYYLNATNNEFFLISSRFEYGFKLFTLLLTKISKNPQILFISCAIITNLLVIIAIKDYFKEYFDWGVIVYVSMLFLPSMNLVRQFMALSISFYSLRYLFRKRDFLFLSGILVSCLFHYTCIVFFIYYLFSKKTIKLLKIFILLFICFLLYKFDFLNYILDKYYYLDYERKINYTMLIIPVFFIFIWFIESYLFNKEKNKRKNNIERIYVYGMILLIVTRFMGSFLIYFTRISLYFIFSYIGLIQTVLLKANIRKKIIYISIFILLLSFNFYNDLVNNNNGILPYNNILLNFSIE